MPEEEDIRRVLEDDQRRSITLYCIEPLDSNEVLAKMRDVWSSYYANNLADDLSKLEGYGVISYKEGKWKTTEISIKVLKKYFGHKP